MATTVLGLSGYRWGNNLKSALMLGAFPVLLLTLLATIFYLYGASITNNTGYVPASYFTMFGTTGQRIVYEDIPQTPLDFATVAVMTYWPYVIGVAFLWTVIGYFFNGAIIHAATGAQQVSRTYEPKLYNLLENLCIARGLKMPALYVIETDVMNAYASGIDERSYAITVTRGILENLNDAEVEAVLGHELTHIINRDCRLLIFTVIFAGMLSFIAQMLWRNMYYVTRSSRSSSGKNGASTLLLMLIASAVMFVGYLMALVLRFALSRRREYMADAGSVELTKNPEALISALRKISQSCDVPQVPSEVRQMFIENPPSIFDMGGMFATHPPIDRRIQVLEEIAGEAGVKSHGASVIPPSA